MLLQMISLKWQAGRCVYVSGFFNDVLSIANTNFVVYLWSCTGGHTNRNLKSQIL